MLQSLLGGGGGALGASSSATSSSGPLTINNGLSRGVIWAGLGLLALVVILGAVVFLKRKK